MTKRFVGVQELKEESLKLGMKVVNSGFKPDFLICLWRGGASIGLYIHELLKYKGVETDHIAIRTSKYTGINKASSTVNVHNLGYIRERVKKDSKVLIVDDIFETGHSIQAVLEAMKLQLKENYPEDIRIATLHYKPSKNLTERVPDYYGETTDSWIVYPHELEELTPEEIRENMGENIYNIIFP